MADKAVVVYIATYTSLDEAKAGYEAVKQLHSAGVIGTYDAAVISKDEAGKVKIVKTEKPTQHGTWAGMAVGALVGLFFPPFLLFDAVIGAGAGALSAHFWRGLPRSEMQKAGDTLAESTATLIVIGQSKLQHALKDATKHALKQFETELSTDGESFKEDLEAAVNESRKAEAA